MSKDHALTGKTVLVDLTTNAISYFDTSQSLLRAFLGSRGVNVHYLYKFLPKDMEPFSPENVLIVGTGPLTGTIAPCACRFNVSAKSPETGFLGDSSCGGFFGPEMRYSGFDRVIVRGKAPSPKLIFLSNGTAEIRGAAEYWGLDSFETQVRLRENFGDIVSLAIGPAGENLVRFAGAVTGVKNMAARTGMGAVMGSKNLKAIVAKGEGGAEVSDPEGLLREVESLKDYITESRVIPVLGRVGTSFLYRFSNELGAIRTMNAQLNAFSENLNSDKFEPLSEKMISCASCFVHCRHRNTEGGEGPEYSTIGLLGANLGIDSAEAVVRLNNLCNRLGLDSTSAGSILSWTIELYEKGLIDESITEEKLSFGDASLAERLLLKTARRDGFGNILAEGSRACEKFGEKSLDYLIAVKGLPQSDPHDVRYVKAFALGIATASRGADHLRSRATLEVYNLPQETKDSLYGPSVSTDPFSYEGKEKPVIYSEHIFAVIDSVGLCKFVSHGFNSPKLLNHEHVARLLELVTGIPFTREELIEAGRRIIDMERIFNQREGLSRRDDTLPRRYFEEEMKLKKTKGHKIEREEFEKLLSRYYDLRGWSKDGEVPQNRVNEILSIM